jgi:SET domain-containing protein
VTGRFVWNGKAGLVSVELNPRIEVRSSPIAGRGLFAVARFANGERFSVTAAPVADGSVIMDDTEFAAYTRSVEAWDAVYLGNGRHRVSTRERNDDPANYGNHSCDPNTALDGAGWRIAVKDIAPGDEITIDYGLLSPRQWSMACSCGAPTCTGVVRGKL